MCLDCDGNSLWLTAGLETAQCGSGRVVGLRGNSVLLLTRAWKQQEVTLEESFVSMVTLDCLPQAQKQHQVTLEELQEQHKSEKMALMEELERKHHKDTHNMMEEFRRQAQRALANTPTQVRLLWKCLYVPDMHCQCMLSQP